MSDPLSGLLAALDLTDTGARTAKDIFTGPSQWMPHGRVFGGQVLAQSVMAAIRTVPEERVIHSVHGYFLRPGDISLPITFAVDRIHDGRSFSTRRTQAYQRGLPILSMISSFQTQEVGLDHQAAMPEGIPDPETLPHAADILPDDADERSRFWTTQSPFDLRSVNPDIQSVADPERTAHQAVWVRAVRPMPDDPNLHRAALAYLSDYSLIDPVLRRHGLTRTQSGLRMASLDHAMWWHRFARVDEWLLYVQDSPNAVGGRGLSFGRIFSRDGTLVASVAQEGMIRVPDPSRHD